MEKENENGKFKTGAENNEPPKEGTKEVESRESEADELKFKEDLKSVIISKIEEAKSKMVKLQQEQKLPERVKYPLSIDVDDAHGYSKGNSFYTTSGGHTMYEYRGSSDQEGNHLFSVTENRVDSGLGTNHFERRQLGEKTIDQAVDEISEIIYHEAVLKTSSPETPMFTKKFDEKLRPIIKELRKETLEKLSGPKNKHGWSPVLSEIGVFLGEWETREEDD